MSSSPPSSPPGPPPPSGAAPQRPPLTAGVQRAGVPTSPHPSPPSVPAPSPPSATLASTQLAGTTAGASSGSPSSRPAAGSTPTQATGTVTANAAGYWASIAPAATLPGVQSVKFKQALVYFRRSKIRVKARVVSTSVTIIGTCGVDGASMLGSASTGVQKMSDGTRGTPVVLELLTHRPLKIHLCYPRHHPKYEPYGTDLAFVAKRAGKEWQAHFAVPDDYFGAGKTAFVKLYVEFDAALDLKLMGFPHGVGPNGSGMVGVVFDFNDPNQWPFRFQRDFHCSHAMPVEYVTPSSTITTAHHGMVVNEEKDTWQWRPAPGLISPSRFVLGVHSGRATDTVTIATYSVTEASGIVDLWSKNFLLNPPAFDPSHVLSGRIAIEGTFDVDVSLSKHTSTLKHIDMGDVETPGDAETPGDVETPSDVKTPGYALYRHRHRQQRPARRPRPGGRWRQDEYKFKLETNKSAADIGWVEEGNQTFILHKSYDKIGCFNMPVADLLQEPRDPTPPWGSRVTNIETYELTVNGAETLRAYRPSAALLGPTPTALGPIGNVSRNSLTAKPSWTYPVKEFLATPFEQIIDIELKEDTTQDAAGAAMPPMKSSVAVRFEDEANTARAIGVSPSVPVPTIDDADGPSSSNSK
ncbi:unnamed protein product [Vitrella brassicaformis CCMP3155]|uniref:Uncharacterized protein n=1 Tax=Vitrella brassicaformis (strain CCMP3155) TaxID=1169540 RepID=A0A0G4ELH0_VITBC|nr:unnamed protein product [Vitrella brassicaformis CCMP3155]|eukprot:CEL97663.1 unnamed protein product [Vitrella brassicaformis CCMP3155]